MNNILLGLVATYIKNSVKNEEKKRKMRNICLQIYNAIKTAFAGDSDFE